MVVVPCGQPTGMASVPVQSFCWLEDVTLSGPCFTALIQPQGDSSFSQKMYRVDDKGKMFIGNQLVPVKVSVFMFPQQLLL